ncbi:MAG: hypothetical protein U0324_45960 [Polyangiales bacterium]
MVRTTRTAPNRRGSPEAVEKRRLARKLNRLLTEGSDPAAAQDGRTERRRQRLLQELEEGTRANPPTLKPIEVLQRAHDLLTLGEPLASLRKVIRVPTRPPVDPAEASELLASLQRAYDFRPEVFEFLGLPAEALVQTAQAPRRGRPRKT